MRPGVSTAQPPVLGRKTLWWALVAGAAVLALGLATVTVGPEGSDTAPASYGREPGACGTVVPGAALAQGAVAQQQSCMQPRSAALHDSVAISWTAPTVQLHQQVIPGRGRARFQSDTQSVLRLVRERQAAVITAFTHRLRDASVPGATSHTADRPLIVTRPLRGPPAHA